MRYFCYTVLPGPELIIGFLLMAERRTMHSRFLWIKPVPSTMRTTFVSILIDHAYNTARRTTRMRQASTLLKEDSESRPSSRQHEHPLHHLTIHSCLQIQRWHGQSLTTSCWVNNFPYITSISQHAESTTLDILG